MKTVSLFDNYGALNSKPVFDAFKVGLQKQGYTVKHNTLDADIAVIWSMLWHGRMSYNKQIFHHFRKLKKDVIVLEVGSISRGNTWRVGINGISNSQLIRHSKSDTPRSCLFDLTLAPWRSSGNVILICGQHGKSQLWSDMPPVAEWVSQTIDSIRMHTDMSIVVRPHPRYPLPKLQTLHTGISIQNPNHIKTTYDDYDLSFNNLHALVCWSSTPAALAVVNGIPVFTGPDSIAYPVANKDLSSIANPLTPDRSDWFTDFTRSEYTLQELEDGMPLKTLTKV